MAQPDERRPRLCQVCLDTIFADGSADDVEYSAERDWTVAQVRHHENRESLLRAVARGCYICQDLNRIPSTGEAKTVANLAFRGPDLLPADLYQLTIEIEALDRNGVMAFCGMQHFSIAHIEPTDATFDLASKSRAQIHTGHPSVLDLAKEWLQQCLTQHNSCRRNCSPESYPTRLLDTTASCIRLIETDEEPPSKPYATMSYCWGSRPFYTLTSSNRAQFMSGIDLTTLPRVFQDVITTTRHLGIQYLWIDACCIIQSGEDAAADWERECAKMKQVYENSMLNIGVPNATSPLDECFTNRQWDRDEPVIVNWQPQAAVDQTKFHVYKAYNPDLFAGFYEAPLFTRAWVFQERFLCPRMLHFDSGGIAWECSGEDGGSILSEATPSFHSLLYVEQMEQHPWSTSASAMQSIDPFEQWKLIIRRYSGLQISFPDKDKLLALGGIANKMALALEDEYIAGMFRKVLVPQLAWYPVGGSRRATRWRAPSWSFFSMDNGEIAHPQPSTSVPEAHLARIVSASVDLVDPLNPYGAIRSAYLELQCRPYRIAKPQPARVYNEISMAGLRFQWQADDEGESYNAAEPFYVVLTEIGRLYELKREQTFRYEDTWTEAVLTEIQESEVSEVELLGVLDDCDRYAKEDVLALLRFMMTNIPEQTITLV